MLTELCWNSVGSIIVVNIIFIYFRHHIKYPRWMMSAHWRPIWWTDVTGKHIDELATHPWHHTSERCLLIFRKSWVVWWNLWILVHPFSCRRFEFILWRIIVVLLKCILWFRIRIIWKLPWFEMTTVLAWFEFELVWSLFVWIWILVIVLLGFAENVVGSWLIKTLGWIFLRNWSILKYVLRLFWSRVWFNGNHWRVRLHITLIIFWLYFVLFWAKRLVEITVFHILRIIRTRTIFLIMLTKLCIILVLGVLSATKDVKHIEKVLQSTLIVVLILIYVCSYLWFINRIATFSFLQFQSTYFLLRVFLLLFQSKIFCHIKVFINIFVWPWFHKETNFWVTYRFAMIDCIIKVFFLYAKNVWLFESLVSKCIQIMLILSHRAFIFENLLWWIHIWITIVIFVLWWIGRLLWAIVVLLRVLVGVWTTALMGAQVDFHASCTFFRCWNLSARVEY